MDAPAMPGDATEAGGEGDGGASNDAVDGAGGGGSGEVEIFTQSGLVCAGALAIDANSIFWLASPPRTGTSIHRGTEVGRIAKQGGAPSLLFKEDRWPRAIATDDTRVYVAVEDDQAGGGVLALDKRGGTPVELARFRAAALAADSSGLYLSTNHGVPPGIHVMRPGATAPEHLAGGTSGRIEDLALDAGYVYWPEGEQILRTPKAGGPVTVLWGPGDGGVGPLLIGVSGAEVYWNDNDEWVRRGPAAGGQGAMRLARYRLRSLNVAGGTVFGIVASARETGRLVRIEPDGSTQAISANIPYSSIVTAAVDENMVYLARCNCACKGGPNEGCREWDCSMGIYGIRQR